MTAFGKRRPVATGWVIPFVIDGVPGVCDSDHRHDRSMSADIAREKGRALIAAADEAEHMAAGNSPP